jgi:DNA repair protein RadD
MLALNIPTTMPIVLRDYQAEAIRSVKDAFRDGRRGVFLVAPTGAGKTQMFTSLVEEWVRGGARCAIAAHRGELIKQAGKTVMSRGLFYGVIKARPSTCPQAPIQIVSIDSMRGRELPWVPDYIVLDEAHLAKAERYTSFVSRYPSAKVLMVSATPVRADGSGFEDIAQELIVSATVNDLIGHPQGPFLVPPRLYTGSDLGAALDEQVKTTAGDYNQGELETFMCQVSLVGDVVTEYQRLAAGRKGVVFCVGIKHSQTVAEQFNAAGIPAEHLDGDMKDPEREAVLCRLHTGQTRIVTNASVLCEGWDEPSISYVGLARPTKSLALYIQQAGRGLRIHPASGKTDCVIIDHGQNVDLHGHILDEREWSLQGTGKVKKKKQKPKHCPACDLLLPQAAMECRVCGWKKIVRLEVNTVSANFQEQKVEHPFLKKYRTMLRFAKAEALKPGKKPRKPGWAYMAMVAQCGKEEVDKVLTYREMQRIHNEEGLS